MSDGSDGGDGVGTTDDAALAVLLALRLKAFAPAAMVAESAGVAVEAVAPLLQRLAARELVKYREGKLTGWLLTPAGRAEGQRLLAEELAVAGPEVRAQVRSGYEQFLAHNHRLLEVCTAWQLLGGASSQVLNDHTDADYDAAVVADLRSLHDDVQPILARLSDVLPRLGGYAERFAAALAKVEAGDPDYFTKPMLESYHTVWFELHENLLATLGIERSQEGAG